MLHHLVLDYHSHSFMSLHKQRGLFKTMKNIEGATAPQISLSKVNLLKIQNKEMIKFLQQTESMLTNFPMKYKSPIFHWSCRHQVMRKTLHLFLMIKWVALSFCGCWKKSVASRAASIRPPTRGPRPQFLVIGVMMVL